MFAEKELSNCFNILSYKEQKNDAKPSCNYNGTAYLRPNQPCFFLNDSNTSVFQRKTQSNSTGLPDQLKTNIESVSGYCLDDVKVHYNSSKPAFFHALAYTQGTEIHVAPGEERHLPHEAWHVVQQKQGRVLPVAELKGQPFNDSSALEQEADTMGNRVTQFNAPVTQMKLKTAFHRAVIQRVSHISVKNDINYDTLPTLLPNPKPTIVFETMGLTQEVADSVYNESKKYSGNTICVFGLNKRDDSLSGTLNKLPDIAEPPHCLRNFSFLWKRPVNIPERAPYEFPFIEARFAVMKRAQSLVTRIINQSNTLQESETNDKKNLFIYRWIDGDAKDDSSERIMTELLTDFAEDENQRLATGPYFWRHDSSNCKGFSSYDEFINQINQAERELRACFFEHFNDSNPSNLTLNQDPNKFYLPEPTLLMNSAAHERIFSSFHHIALNESSQDQESIKMINAAHIPTRAISFINDLSVSKPLKHEFSTSSTESSYIFNGNMKHFFSLKYREVTIDLLKSVMQNFRQSAFNSTNWKLSEDSSNQQLEALRQERLSLLFDFLGQKLSGKTNFELIQTFLKTKQVIS